MQSTSLLKQNITKPFLEQRSFITEKLNNALPTIKNAACYTAVLPFSALEQLTGFTLG